MANGKSWSGAMRLILSGAVILTGFGCQTGLTPGLPIIAGDLNTTDPTNNGATYIGSKACAACHLDIGAQHFIHGHAHILTKLNGAAPSFPSESPVAGVPNPPDNTTWSDVTYVLGGYYRKANFLNSRGFLMTNGVDKVNTQWNLEFLANGTVPGWAVYEPTTTAPKPYDFACFSCHTTGPSPDGHQDSLPGIGGDFAEPGVMCESCHGPGSNHVPHPPLDIYINSESAACGSCHSRAGTSQAAGLQDKNVIFAEGNFIQNYQQYTELLAGPHANIRCVTCHSPHVSTAFKKNDGGIVNPCQACHPDVNIPLHKGIIFVRGDYTEQVTCVSCHMPYASKSASSATPDVVGPNARVADIRTHIWNIDTNPDNYTAMFTADGTQVKRDSNGKAAVTLDFICLRCHNDKGNAFGMTVLQASDIAWGDMHTKFN